MALRLELVETNTTAITEPENEVISFGVSNRAIDGLGFRILGGKAALITEFSSEDQAKILYVIDILKVKLRAPADAGGS